MTRFLPSLLTCAILLGPSLALAADQGGADAKMREALRAMTLQVRTIQGERDALQAEKVQLDQEKKELTEKVGALTKQLAADKDAADKTIADLKTRVLDQATEHAQLRDAIDKAKLETRKANELAAATEVKRAKLADDVIGLKRTVVERETQNRELYKTGSEILSRYEKFGLGTAISAREPFTGITRVKLQTLVQDYQDKLLDQKVKP